MKLLALLPIFLFAISGCWRSSGPEVTVYTALDRDFSEPIFEGFAVATGIAVEPKFDTESTKTVGLAEAILAERARPRCDVFWNNEILHTIRLQQQGLLEPYRPAAADRYPAAYRAADGSWHGFAARARVLVVNTDRVPEADRPASIRDLANPKWAGRVAMAKPLFGTTATHAACLFAVWGDERAKDFYRQMKTNGLQILSGNKQVALAVSAGRVAFGITDTDDAIEEIEKGMPLAIVYPDQEKGGLGTLLIPNTLAIVKGSPHPEAARQLVDYLLTSEVESKLAAGPSAQIPLGAGLEPHPRLCLPDDFRTMPVDFPAAAAKWEDAARFLRDEFTGP